MAQRSDIASLRVGEPIRCIAKLRVNTSYQKEDIKYTDRVIQLVDPNNQMLGQYEANDVFDSTFSAQRMVETSIYRFIEVWTNGWNVSMLVNGSTQSGKSFLLEGSKTEPGLILTAAGFAFKMLEIKRDTQIKSGKIRGLAFNIRIKYVEIINEQLTDLLATAYNNDNLKAVNNEWEGPTIANAVWWDVKSTEEFSDIFIRGQQSRSRNRGEFGRESSKSTGVFIMELTQRISNSDGVTDDLLTYSRFTFFDLPGCEILAEDKNAVMSRQGPDLNKSIFAFNELLQTMVTSRGENSFYDTSGLTTLLRDAIGGNSYCVGIMCLRYGDTLGSRVTLKLMEMLRQINNYPIQITGPTIGLLRKYRQEAIRAFENLQAAIGNKVDGLALNSLNNEKDFIEANIKMLNMAKQNEALSQTVARLREQYNQLVAKKDAVEADLIASEEEKLQIAKNLIEFQIENTKLLEAIQNEKYDANNKLVGQENEILALNIREEQALKLVDDIQDKYRKLLEEKKEFEIELVALKQNFLTIREQLEEERKKNENLGFELINTVNENKALQAQLNTAYKSSSSATENEAKLSTRLDTVQRMYDDQKEALLMARAEIERLKNEILGMKIRGEQADLMVEQKKLDIQKGFLDMASEKENAMKKLSQQAESTLSKNMQDKMVFESQRNELMARTKSTQRKVEELEQKVQELLGQLQEQKSINAQLSTKMDQSDNLYRAKLMEYAMQEKANKDKNVLGFNAREDLVRSYREKEVELIEKLDRERTLIRTLKTELLAMKNFARELKYVAEDYFPPGKPVPEILSRPFPSGDDGMGGNQHSGPSNTMRHMNEDNTNEENERLKKRNAKLEEDVRRLSEQMLAGPGFSVSPPSGQRSYVANGAMPSVEVEELRREKSQLKEECEKLMRVMKESGQYDIYVLRKENERLSKMIREYENNYGAVSPESGEAKTLSLKLRSYEQTIRQQESEKTELLSRATIAESQVKALNQHIEKITTQHSRTVAELKKKLGLN